MHENSLRRHIFMGKYGPGLLKWNFDCVTFSGGGGGGGCVGVSVTFITKFV